jgi:hypothetical protein
MKTLVLALSMSILAAGCALDGTEAPPTEQLSDDQSLMSKIQLSPGDDQIPDLRQVGVMSGGNRNLGSPLDPHPHPWAPEAQKFAPGAGGRSVTDGK